MPSNKLDKFVISLTVWLCADGVKVEGLFVKSFQLLTLLLLSIRDFNTLPWLALNAQSVALEVSASTIVIAPLLSPVAPLPYAATSCSPIKFNLTLKLLSESK